MKTARQPAAPLAIALVARPDRIRTAPVVRRLVARLDRTRTAPVARRLVARPDRTPVVIVPVAAHLRILAVDVADAVADHHHRS